MSAAIIDALTRERIAATAELIAPYIRRTPVIETAAADWGAGDGRLFFKLELMQYAGSFKTRGAFTHLLSRALPQAGVAAASGGNHGVAVAHAARRLGMRATIFVPTISSAAKIARIRAEGATLRVGGDRYADALAASEAWMATSGAASVHAFDQLETLLGQATLGREFAEQAPGLDTLLVAVGGGGLIGGVAAWYRGDARIVAVEPEAAPTLTRALAAGRVVDAETGGIAADSLAPRRVGELMFPLAQQFVAEALLVSDEEIRAAQQSLWDVLRVVAEPGGAAAFAALLAGRYRPRPGERIGVIVSGGNVTAVDFGRSPIETPAVREDRSRATSPRNS